MKFKRSIIDESKVIGFKLLIEFGLKHLVKGKGNKNFKRIFFFFKENFTSSELDYSSVYKI